MRRQPYAALAYAASAHVSPVAGAGVHSELSGETADQLSVALDAPCHISDAGSTSVHTSAVPGKGSHFSIALQAILLTALIKAPLNCTRLTVTTFVVTADIIGEMLTTVTAFALTDALDAAAALCSRTLSQAAVLLAAMLDAALCSRTRSTDAEPVALADTSEALSRTRWAAEVLLADTEADALTSRTLVASDVLLELDAMIDPESLTRTFAAAVEVTPITMASPSFKTPSTP
jgi:hypothetical protein